MEAKVIDGCISCGACIATCPEVFRFDEDGLAEAYAKVTPKRSVQTQCSTVDVQAVFLTGEGGFAYFKTGLFITENEYKME